MGATATTYFDLLDTYTHARSEMCAATTYGTYIYVYIDTIHIGVPAAPLALAAAVATARSSAVATSPSSETVVMDN